jgi:hypothetical protein
LMIDKFCAGRDRQLKNKQKSYFNIAGKNFFNFLLFSFIVINIGRS